jgi:hypothetical protein
MLSFQGWWRQCTRSYLEAASTHCWRRHSVAALAVYTMTLCTAWMPWWRNLDLLVLAGTSTRLNWTQCGVRLHCVIMAMVSPLQVVNQPYIGEYIGNTELMYWCMCIGLPPFLANCTYCNHLLEPRISLYSYLPCTNHTNVVEEPGCHLSLCCNYILASTLIIDQIMYWFLWPNYTCTCTLNCEVMK